MSEGIKWNSGDTSKTNSGAYATNMGGSDELVGEIRKISVVLRELVGEERWSGKLGSTEGSKESRTTNVVAAAALPR